MESFQLLLLLLISDPSLLEMQVLRSPDVVHCLLMVRRVDRQLAMSAIEVSLICNVVHTLLLQDCKLCLSGDAPSFFHFDNQLQKNQMNHQIKAKYLYES